MSEYQHYEFRALDRPLDAAAQNALRQLSTRAHIDSRSFVNTYQWGDFKGDPRRLVEDWFDLFLCWANWGSRKLMFRIPRSFHVVRYHTRCSHARRLAMPVSGPAHWRAG